MTLGDSVSVEPPSESMPAIKPKAAAVLRWMAAFPAAVAGFFAVWLVYAIVLSDSGDVPIEHELVLLLVANVCGISAGVITAPWQHCRAAFIIFAAAAVADCAHYVASIGGFSRESIVDLAATLGGIIGAYAATWRLRRTIRGS